MNSQFSRSVILNSTVLRLTPNLQKSTRQEIGLRMQFQQSRNMLNDFIETQNILNLVSYISLNMATFDYIFMFKRKLWENLDTFRTRI